MKCLYCTKEFEQKRKNQIYCNDYCGNSFRVRKYRQSHPEKIYEFNRRKYQKHKYKLLAQMKEYRRENKELISKIKHREYLRNKKKYQIRNKQYYLNNIDKIRIIKRENYLKNKDKIKERSRIRYLVKKEEFKIKRREYIKKNKIKVIKRQVIYEKNRRINDPIFNLIGRLRSRLSSSLNSYVRNGKTKRADEYGIDYKELSKYLIKTFPSDWNNRYQWHIDHIIPLIELNNVKEENIPFAIRLLFSKENLQWLYGKENMLKRDKIPNNLSSESKNILEQLYSLKMQQPLYSSVTS